MSDDHGTDWSAEQILAEYPRLGIPHFQRGLVWNSDAVSLLLESLFHSTPCGTILLWSCVDPGREGISLIPGQDLERLIVDGQQRIRSIWNALRCDRPGSEIEEEVEEGIQPDVRSVWCLNLARIPGLAALQNGIGRVSPLFCLHRTAPDGAARRDPRDRIMVPLDLLLEERRNEILARVDLTHAAIVASVLPDLTRQLHAMRSQPLFHVITLRETDGRNGLDAMVTLYNRINSGGQRVDAEERGYATLVSLWPGTGPWLRETFTEVHPDTAPRRGAHSRDQVLERRKERSFGFKLFIRTLVQVCAYHFAFRVGSASFSFEVLNYHRLHALLRDASRRREVGALFEQTGQVLTFVRTALRECLYCDTLQTLPDATSLWPVFQLLIRFPSLMTTDPATGQRVVGALVLRLMLGPRLTQRDILTLVSVVTMSHTVGECLSQLDKRLTPRLGGTAIAGALAQANSLQDRHVLMLYWLLRRKRARDFGCPRRPDSKCTVSDGQACSTVALLAEDVVPEKQHLVPYGVLKVLYEMDGPGRISTHEANSIGNLTWISHELNAGDSGLWDKTIDLAREDTDTLRAHFLTDEGGLHARYGEAIEPGDRTRRRECYREFCGIRRASIAQAFAEWIRDEPLANLVPRRIEPAPQSFQPSVYDKIRGFGYPDAVEDAAIRCLAPRGFKARLIANGSIIRLTPADRGRSREVAIDLRQGAVELTDRATGLFEAVRRRLPAAGATFHDRPLHGGAIRRTWYLRVSEDHAPVTAALLDRIAGEVRAASGGSQARTG